MLNNELTTLYVLVGPPCTGKSTYLKDAGWEYIISRDDLVMEFGSKSLPTPETPEDAAWMNTYNNCWNALDKKSHKEIDKTLMVDADAIMTLAKMTGENMAVDMTNLTVKSRKKWIDFAERHKVQVAALSTIWTPEEVLERAKGRTGKIISPKILKDMMGRFEAPKRKEGFKTVVPIDTTPIKW